MYPGVSERIKAVVFDSIVAVVYFLIVSSIIGESDYPWSVRITLFSLVFLYDPLMTSLLGGTIGHFAVGIRVKKKNNESKNINIVAAAIRFVLKYVLGWLSFISMSFNEESRAIHDLVTGSVVIYKPKS